jgi:outer membrane protein OmpA-like peptidoglycan-associated protein
MLRKEYFFLFGRNLTGSRQTPKAIFVLAYLVSMPVLAQQSITGIMTDYGGYFESRVDAVSAVTDGDGIPDYLDLDSDNDGLFDVVEADMGVDDVDGDGRVDNFSDNQPTGLPDGLHDTIDPAFDPLDTDDDGVPDFRDTDSDDDGLNDLEESTGSKGITDTLDANSDGIIDSIDPTTGLPLNSAGQAVVLSPIDSDANGIPDFREADSVAGGAPEKEEELETSVRGAGSASLITLFVLVVGVATRIRAAWFKTSGLLSVAFAGFLVSGSFAPNVQADTHCGYQNSSDDEFTNCWYLGAGYGFSHVDPEGASNGWHTDDDESEGWEVILGKHFKPHWFGELKYADIGEAGLGNTSSTLDTQYHEANISYRVPSLMLGYYLLNENRRFNLYGKAGVAAIINNDHDHGNTLDFEEVTDAQLALGAGLQFRARDSRWFARLNFDSYDRDAWYASISLYRYFGSHKKQRQELPPQPVVISDPKPVIVEPVAECASFNTALSGVNFATASHQLTENAKQVLKPYAKILRRHTDTIVSIEAHTDSVGREAANLMLSQRRAESVRNLLVFQGVNKEQLQVHGYGELQPIANNQSVEGRARNRRVEINIIASKICP